MIFNIKSKFSHKKMQQHPFLKPYTHRNKSLVIWPMRLIEERIFHITYTPAVDMDKA